MTTDHSNAKKTVRGVFWTLIGQGSNLVRFASTLVLARLLAPEDFGVVAIAVSIVSFAHLLRDWGWHQAIIQRYDINEKELSSIFWIIVLSSLGISILLLFLSNYFAIFYRQSRLPCIIALLTVDFWLRSSFQVSDALLRRQMNFKVSAIADLSGGLIGGFFGIVIALLGGGIYSLAIRIILNSAVLFVYLWHTANWRPQLFFCGKTLLSFSSFGVPIFLIGILGLARSQAEPIIIGKWFSANDLGIYSMAYSLVTVITVQWAQAISRVAFSSLSKVQNNMLIFQGIFLRFNMIILFFVVPIAIFVSHEASHIVSIMLGSKWHSVAEPLRVLVWAGVGLSMFTISTTAFRSLGKTGVELRLNVGFTIGLIVSIAVGAFSGSLYILSICVSLWIFLASIVANWYVLFTLDITVASYFSINKGIIISSLFCVLVLNGVDDFLLSDSHKGAAWYNVISIFAIIIFAYLPVAIAFEWKCIARLYSLVVRRI